MSIAGIVLLMIIISCFQSHLSSIAAKLPPDEVEALREIGKTLKKKDWNFKVDPCGGEASGWISHDKTIPGFNNTVICNCSYPNHTLCHVTHISLKSQSLQGTLPPQLVRLPFLEEIDLTRNYLSGPIPPQWGSTNLLKIALIANRLTGPIPEEIGNISTLKELILEINHLSGSLPPVLGNLSNLTRLVITSNNFSGELPHSLERLTLLKDFRIGDNQFSGQIPKFIQNWANLEKLHIQASGLSGPIPSEIGLLSKLIDLRISDLNGASSHFPPLNTLINLKYLILRNCNITGELPKNLSGLTSLITLDFSFNKISGQIPLTFQDLLKKDGDIYLAGNLLNGPVPPWMLQSQKSIDISYNNFTEGHDLDLCHSPKLNVFASSSQDNPSGIIPCLAACKETRYSLHINCGGKEELINATTFEEDSDTGESSLFFHDEANWAFSNTGNFMDGNRTSLHSIQRNLSVLSMKNPELYTTARVSPISLTYYAYCMGNGSYTVSLHFAEIIFTNDTTFSSLGRRVFDIYIQGKRELKDFNIADAAGGVGKPFTRNFTVSVSNGTLEIRFFWAGKGTNSVPVKGIYGPLISAISVNPDFKPPSNLSSEGGNTISLSAVVGIVVPLAFVIFLIL